MSTPDPRDRALEGLLRQRREAPAAPAESCPDAETLATWLDGGLDATAAAALESHASTCARCRATMATLVESLDETPAAAPDSEAIAPGETPRSASAPTGPRRWLLPLTAAAAATLVWMLAPERETTMVGEIESTQARAEAPAAEAVPPPVAVEPVAPAAPAPPAASATASAKATEPAAVEAARPPARDQAGPTVSEDRSAEARAGRARSAELAAPAPAAPASPAAAAPPAPAVAETLVVQERRAENAFAASTVRSGDPTSPWRLAGPRLVERSVDGGVTWTRVETGAGDDLTAGAAPSADVCWLVGRNGLVLRTTDGRTWQPAARPTAGDLVSVDADDALRATVRTAGGSAFRTMDGGATWAAVP